MTDTPAMALTDATAMAWVVTHDMNKSLEAASTMANVIVVAACIHHATTVAGAPSA